MQKRMAASDLSLSTPLRSDEDDGRTMMDLMSDHQGIPEEVVAADELRKLVSDKLHAYAARLKGRDLVIMRERLLSDEPMTLKDIGDRYGISRERARQLEKRLMTQLREYLTTELGDNVVVALGFTSRTPAGSCTCSPPRWATSTISLPAPGRCSAAWT